MNFFKCCLSVVLIFFISCGCNENNNTESQPVRPAKDETKSMLQQAVKNYPDSLAIAEQLIEAYRNDGSYDSAISLTDTYLKRYSENSFLWKVKATLHFENNDTVNAIESLKNAIRIMPMPEYIVALGTLYAEMGDQSSLAIANELLRNNKTSFGKDAYFIKGLYFNFINEPRSAIPLLDSCLGLDYTYMYAYREKAIALYHLNRYTEAVEVLKRAVTIQNNYDEGYFWLGKCYEKLNKKEDAVQSYQQALLYDKDFAEAHEALNRLQKEK